MSSNRFARRPQYVLIAALVTSCCWSASHGKAADVVEQLNEYMDAAVEFKRFNGSVIVAKGDQILLSKGYGLANVEHQVPNTAQTKFRIGSITKQFTAMATLILAERGKLDVNDKIGEHIEEAPETWKDVTIHHLLTHTSGIPSFTSMSQYRRDMMLPQTITQMVDRFQDKPLEFAPGDRFRYCNSGYFLLGAVIEKAAGVSYEEFLRKEICKPLDLHDTGYDRYATVLKHRASGYNRLGLGVVHAPYLDMSQPYAAGSMYSTVEDLLRWDRALRQGKLIAKQGYDQMYTPEKANYAYGWRVTNKSGRQVISHGGGINGFTSYILRAPGDEICVVSLSNIQPSAPSRIATDLSAIIFEEKYKLPTARAAAEVDSKLFEDYPGKYMIQPGLIVTISQTDGQLFAEATDQGRIELLPESATRFFAKGLELALTFVRDEEQKHVTGLLIKQGGRLLVGKRLE